MEASTEEAAVPSVVNAVAQWYIILLVILGARGYRHRHQRRFWRRPRCGMHRLSESAIALLYPLPSLYIVIFELMSIIKAYGSAPTTCHHQG